MSLLITDIGELTTMVAGEQRRGDAAVLIDGDRIAWIGDRCRAPAADEALSIGGRAMLPGWVDSHTHIVFAGDRAEEFERRMAGAPYAAGGIGATVRATRAASREELTALAAARVAEARAAGTTTLEAKTGYGLDLDTEVELARVAAVTADVVTYLGAHVVLAGVDRRDYIDLVTGPMLRAVAPYATFIDVFCEVGAFDVEESREVLRAGRRAGLALKVHGNQLGQSGGVALAVELGAVSVDHCNALSDVDIDALAASQTVATLLPACDLSTRQPFAPARRLVDAGVTIALASNCNPGTSFTTSMQFQVATAVLQQHLTLDEALSAATIGGAKALGLADEPAGTGTLVVGGRADLQVLDAPSVAHIAYRPGMPLTTATWRGGERARPRVSLG